ncbi:MAG: transporter, partial [Rhodococcus sp. (in: high G+C Gram-positive bacteria)]
LIGTVYGMNFDDMPELHWHLGYPFALSMMFLTCGSLYTIFKRRGWL